MAKPQSIFVKYAGDKGDIVDAIGEVVGQSLTGEDRDVGTIHRGRALDVEFSLFGDHGLLDDSGIEFSKYDYQLKLTPFEVGLRTGTFDAMYQNLALFLAERLAASLRCETMVVENLQREIATFQPEGTRPGRR